MEVHLINGSPISKMKDLGSEKNCLGINISQGENYINLNQTKYSIISP